ncbi:MAG: hypothetical protein JSV62_00955 [Promethearchaeota archaeon]|nr:MAG: hypothetical protein JSV62_00955 [Candidatus Lokiarchaeota archaeon]
MKEFKINQYITLKLEEEIIDKQENLKKTRTNIYVKGEKFQHCSFLLIDIPIENPTLISEITSIDEAEEKLDTSLDDEDRDPFEYIIPPETEFWGHCSNIQVWAENNYNTKLLHRNLAFPLLKKLTEVGDPIAKRIFKEEIAKRFASCHLTVIHFLLFENYLDYLSEEELDVMFKEFKSQNQLLFLYFEPIFMIKGYIRHNLTDKEFEQYLNRFYSDAEKGKFPKLNIYENLQIDHNFTMRTAFVKLWKDLDMLPKFKKKTI